MSEDWAAVAAEVAGALGEVGGAGIIRRYTKSGPSYDPTLTPTDYPCTVFQDMVELTKMTGTLIEVNDRRVYVAASGLMITPTTADKWVLDGREYAIKSVRPLQPDPNGAVIMHEIVFTV
jgi:hypothetical protein